MTPTTEDPPLETTTEAALRVGVSPRTLLRWLRAGQIAGTRTAGGHWRVDPADLEAFVAAQHSAAAITPGSHGPRILVVEDQAQHATAFVRLLRLLEPNAEVHHAADAVWAALLLGTVVPHLAFVDIELPDVDGIELIRRARQLPGLRCVRFVVASGHLSTPRIAQLGRLGVHDILLKPITPQQVRPILDEVSAGGTQPSADTTGTTQHSAA